LSYYGLSTLCLDLGDEIFILFKVVADAGIADLDSFDTIVSSLFF